MSLETLKSLRENVNWKWKNQRYRLLDRLYFLIENWEGQLPELRDVFRRKEIDWLLQADVKNQDLSYQGLLVEFAIKTGYKDELQPKVDEVTGKPLTRRTTPLHHAARHRVSRDIVLRLFEIYHRFDVNYSDEFGRTHFYVACEFDCDEIVAKFLELREVSRSSSAGPNHRVEYPPLHSALFEGRRDEAERLLRAGADQNLADEERSTPLHVICERGKDDGLLEFFFDVIGDMKKKVDVNAKDKLGRTPLHYAVANFMPDTVDALLGYGADLGSFVFPTEAFVMNYVESFRACTYDTPHLKALFDALQVLDRLVERSYDFEQSDTLYIMEMFAKHEHPLVDPRGNVIYQNVVYLISAPVMHIIGKPNHVLRPALAERISRTGEALDACWRRQPAIPSHDLTIHDCLRLPAKRLHRLFVEFGSSNRLSGCDQIGIALMCERARSRLGRKWALAFLYLTLWRERLPIVCCEKVIERLDDADLLNIGRAATGQY